MNETYVTIRGRLVADPNVRTTRSGAPMTVFRIASSVRRPVQGQQGVWEDAGTSFYDVVTYKALAANASVSLRKGHPVSIHGRQRIVSRPKDDGTTWWGVEVVADAVGHDLSYGTTAFAKVGFGGPGFGAPETDAYVVEGEPGRGLGEVSTSGDDGFDRAATAPDDGEAGHVVDSGPLVPTDDEAAA